MGLRIEPDRLLLAVLWTVAIVLPIEAPRPDPLAGSACRENPSAAGRATVFGQLQPAPRAVNSLNSLPRPVLPQSEHTDQA